MQPLSAPAHDLPLFDAAATRAIESRAAAGLAPHTLMQRAGAAVARLGLAVAPHARRVRVYAGPGNNGGDGFEAARHLRDAGRHVEIVIVGDAGRLPADAAASLVRAREAGVQVLEAFVEPMDAHDLAVDALLGIGAMRAPGGPMADAIGELNALPCTVLAIDLPSGLHAGTGCPLGEVCVNADHTLALLTAKPGLFTGQGRDHAGRVWLDEIGCEPGGEPPSAVLAGATHASGPPRRHAQHKGSFGDVAIVGGAPGMSGAALLAARAAHAAGAGRVFVQLLDVSGMTLDPLRPELMFRARWSESDPQRLAASTVACGCGGGEAVAAVLPRLLAHVPRLVLDADALNAIAADTALQSQLRRRASRGQATVLTPHPLEAARLLGAATAEVQRDRLTAARTLAQSLACAVLVKGSGTVVATPGDTPWINPTGNAALATAGTGDVLAGWLAGRWAQGAQAAPGSVAIGAAWSHGRAADGFDGPVLRAADLVERLAALPPA
jgi:hydroxyethylthiazole kinase-like uncharacterized protein yjeF